MKAIKDQLPEYFQQYLDGRFQQVENKIDALKIQINRLDFATNPDHISLVARVKVIEDRTDKLETWRNILSGAWIMAIIVFSIFGFAVRQFLTDITNHIYKH